LGISVSPLARTGERIVTDVTLSGGGRKDRPLGNRKGLITIRFVSHIREFSVQVIEPRVHHTQYGDRVTDREGYVAQFKAGDVTEADVEFAEKYMVKEGLVYGRKLELDEVTLTPLVNRLSVFDTGEVALAENWEPEFREHVEQFLLQRSIDHPDFRLVTELPVPPPWPRYLDFRGTMTQLLKKIIDDGHEPRHVLAYERQSGHRQQVIDALEQLVVDQETAQYEQEPKELEQEVPA
jgi:hypothetical protein